MKKTILRTCLNVCGFLIIANLPFLTIAHLVGIDTFIDSFEHPGSYYYVKNENIQSMDVKSGYIILEKPTEQGFSVGEGDQILYHSMKDSLQQRTVYQIKSDDGITTYYIVASGTDNYEGPIYEHQIIGKIIGNLKDTIWNNLCLQIWELSIDHLNAMALFS